MAKNCINPQCGKEIPSNALFCSYCGTQQVENEKLSEEEKLRKELSEMHQTAQLLKKALADAQQNNNSSADNIQTIKEKTRKPDTQLKKEEDEQAEIPPISPELNETENNKTNGNKQWLVLVLIAVVLVGFWSVIYFQQNKNESSEYSSRQQIAKNDVNTSQQLPAEDILDTFNNDEDTVTDSVSIAELKNEAGIATFRVTVPVSTPETAFVGIAGNWGDSGGIIMQRHSDGTYQKTANVPADFQYKYMVSVDGVTWNWDYCEDLDDYRKMPVDLQANDVISRWTNEPKWKEEDVIINGVKWATCNVDKPGTFAANPEDAGMFYQWNRKKAWAATGDVTDWDNTTATGSAWEKANDPSPAGWRVPTLDEIRKLLDIDRVSSVWTTQNGTTGRKFIDKATGNTLFLPAAGYRFDNDGSLNSVRLGGYYWSGTEYDMIYAYGFGCFNGYDSDWLWNSRHRCNGLSVRSVEE